MGKSDQNAARSSAQNQINQNNANESAVSGITSGILGNSQATAAGILPGVTAGYSDIASGGGGLDPTAQKAYTNLANTGGVSQDLLQYGGISPEQAQAMKDEVGNAARSTYSTAADQANRTAAATGGYGNTSAIQSSLARQGSEAASRAAVSSDASVAGLQQQGRLQATSLQNSGITAGAGGLAQGQQNITANKLAGLGGNTNIYGLNEQQTTATVNQILQNYQQTGQMNNQDLAILTNLANQPGVFDKIIGTIGSLGGAAAGVIGAVKPFGF